MDGSRLVVHNLNVKKTLLQALFDLFMCGNFHKTHTYYLLCVRVCVCNIDQCFTSFNILNFCGLMLVLSRLLCYSMLTAQLLSL